MIIGQRKGVSIPRVPQQRTRFGVAGYVGRVNVYDPQYPGMKLVGGEDLQSEEEIAEKPKRKKKQTEVIDG